MIQFKCARCAKAFRVDDSYAGKHAKCSGCGQEIVVPRMLASQSSRPVALEDAEQSPDFINSSPPSSVNLIPVAPTADDLSLWSFLTSAKVRKAFGLFIIVFFAVFLGNVMSTYFTIKMATEEVERMTVKILNEPPTRFR